AQRERPRLSTETSLLAAWVSEPGLEDERQFTPWASGGWSSWNAMSPEREFCDLIAAFARLLSPKKVVETGVGQGYTTRRVAADLGEGQSLLCFESDTAMRAALAGLPFFRQAGRTLAEAATPIGSEFEDA